MLRSTSIEETRTYLSLLPGIQNLWLLPHAGKIPAPVLEIPPLKHLFCDLRELFRFIPFSSFRHPIFHNITHLEVLGIDFGIGDIESDWNGLAALPRLTHLALNLDEIIPLCVYICCEHSGPSARCSSWDISPRHCQ
jgi:hypothetical protein